MEYKMSLTNIIADALKPKPIYGVPSHAINEIFRLNENLLFRDVPNLHHVMLMFLGKSDNIRHGGYEERYGRLGKIYLTDPNERARIANRAGNRDDPMPTSPGILVTKYPISAVRTGLGVIIRDQLSNRGSAIDRMLPESLKFAMHGYFDDHNMFTVEKLMLPNAYRRDTRWSKGLKPVDLNEETIDRSLYYARLCADQLYERERFTPEENFAKAGGNIPPAASLKVRSHTP